MYSAYVVEYRVKGLEAQCASYATFDRAFQEKRGSIAFRHGKGGFPTCEFCNVVEHMLKKSREADLGSQDALSTDAVEMLAQVMILHREQQGEVDCEACSSNDQISDHLIHV